MKVFKFGGASVKDADSVRNVASVLRRFPGEDLAVVVSAMGKTTNALEELTEAFYNNDNAFNTILDKLVSYHTAIMKDLFKDAQHAAFKKVSVEFEKMRSRFGKKHSGNYNLEYDQLVSMGEVISTLIVSEYIAQEGLPCRWADARLLVSTDHSYRDGNVNFDQTRDRVKQFFSGFKGITITQGFVGSAPDGTTVTLGREGSDYTAAILAWSLDAENVTIWKDVPGVMNADPKWFDETRLISELSYQDAIELSYYGATVIHPKTIKPLQNKKIPLHVRSFLQPEAKGTVIKENSSQLPIPCFIFKINQILLTISPKDFSFIVEENFSDIFRMFSEHRVKINTMQNSALSFSVCLDNDPKKIPTLTEKLRERFRVLYNDKLELITIRYYDQATIDRVCIGKTILLEQKSRYTVQLVVKNA